MVEGLRDAGLLVSSIRLRDKLGRVEYTKRLSPPLYAWRAQILLFGDLRICLVNEAQTCINNQAQGTVLVSGPREEVRGMAKDKFSLIERVSYIFVFDVGKSTMVRVQAESGGKGGEMIT